MGQLFPNDPSISRSKQIATLNSKPVAKLTQLRTVSEIKAKYYQIVYGRQNDNIIECIYRFTDSRYVSVKLRKKRQSYADQLEGYLSNNGDYVYGYKVKYRPKSVDRIKYLLYKKRIYGDVQTIFDILAELKLLSLLKIGPYMGSMIDGSDGFIMNGYAEYYTQNIVTFKPNNIDELFDRINANFDYQKVSIISNFGFSVCFSQFVVKPYIKPHLLQINQSQAPMNKSVSEIFKQKNSQYIKPSAMQDRYLKQIKNIDEKTNMLSSIENSLIHKNIDKAIEVYQKVLNREDNAKSKVKFIYSYVQLLGDCVYFRDYQEQVIQEYLNNSQLQKDLMIQGRNYRKELEQKANMLRLSNRQFSSENQLEEFSQTFSISGSSIQKEKLKLNIQDSNNQRIKQIIKQMNRTLKPGSNNGINLGNDDFNQQIIFQYGVMLMNTGKSRLALNLFYLLYRSQKVSLYIKYKISNFMGIIYYNRNYNNEAKSQFERSLTKIIQMRYYSPALSLAYNNIGCAFYQQKDYMGALRMFNNALNLDCGRNDYQVLIKNNRAVTYIRLDMKEAKDELDNILNKGQPINNAFILCKLFTNIGYLSMRNKQFSKAKQQFKYAIELEQKCLRPLGYRPSTFLHNNMAMARYKLRQFRAALDHFNKYASQFERLKSLQGVMVNFNIALAHKQCYKLQGAAQYVAKCRRLIDTLPAKYKEVYEKKIYIEIENINRNNIDELSNQSSNAAFDNNMISNFRLKDQTYYGQRY